MQSTISVIVGASFTPVEVRADEAEVQYRLALRHKRAGRTDQALQAAREAVRLRPTHAAAHFTIGALLRRSVRRARLVIALSECTKRDLVRLAGAEEARVRVVPLGAVYFAGVVVVGVLLAWEQSLVRADDLSQVKRAFDMNGWVGVLYLATTALAIYWP